MGQSVSVQQNINQSIQIKFKEDVFGPEEQKIPTSYLTFILKEKKIVNAVSSFSSSFEKKRKHYEGSCSVFFLNNRSKCCYFTLCSVSAFNFRERSLFQLSTSFFTWKSIKSIKRITANTLSIHLIPFEQQEQFQC